VTIVALAELSEHIHGEMHDHDRRGKSRPSVRRRAVCWLLDACISGEQRGHIGSDKD
jgi:hypothetical protein